MKFPFKQETALEAIISIGGGLTEWFVLAPLIITICVAGEFFRRRPGLELNRKRSGIHVLPTARHPEQHGGQSYRGLGKVGLPCVPAAEGQEEWRWWDSWVPVSSFSFSFSLSTSPRLRVFIHCDDNHGNETLLEQAERSGRLIFLRRKMLVEEKMDESHLCVVELLEYTFFFAKHPPIFLFFFLGQISDPLEKED